MYNESKLCINLQLRPYQSQRLKRTLLVVILATRSVPTKRNHHLYSVASFPLLLSTMTFGIAEATFTGPFGSK